ncbi:MAG TPA: hypothetical protein VF261_00520 [Candidatus Saccharimonadales bacterium]
MGRTELRANDEGLTIVELIVTIIVLGILVIAITNLFIGIQHEQRQAGFLVSATHAAQTEVETLRNNSYTSLTNGQTIDFTSQLPSNLPQATGTVQVSTPAADLRRVDVTVSYAADNSTHQVTLSSIIGVIGISQ